jgi:hypothetical protein
MGEPARQVHLLESETPKAKLMASQNRKIRAVYAFLDKLPGC